MTPEERLTQTEELLETAARYIDRHYQAIEQNAADIRQLRASINDVLRLFSDLAAYQRQSQEDIRRIWEYLLAQKSNGSSNN